MNKTKTEERDFSCFVIYIDDHKIPFFSTCDIEQAKTCAWALSDTHDVRLKRETTHTTTVSEDVSFTKKEKL
jgi:hypothetical protein